MIRRREFVSVLVTVGSLVGCGDDEDDNGGSTGAGGTGGTGGDETGGSGGDETGGADTGGTGGDETGGADAGGTGGDETGGTGGDLTGGTGGATNNCPDDLEVSGTEISANHGHTFTLPAEDIAAGTEKTYTMDEGLTVGLGHTHDITVTAANFAALQAGDTVTIESADGGDPAHTHEVTLVCA